MLILCRNCKYCDVVSGDTSVLVTPDILICKRIAAPEKYLIKDELWECDTFEESEKGFEKRLGNKNW